MYELKKGYLTLKNISKADLDLYKNAGWKVVKKPQPSKVEESVNEERDNIKPVDKRNKRS